MRDDNDKNGNQADLVPQQKPSSELESKSDTDEQFFVCGSTGIMTLEEQKAFVERIERKQLAKFRNHVESQAKRPHNIEDAQKDSESSSKSSERGISHPYFTRKRKNDEGGLIPSTIDASQPQKSTRPSKVRKLVLHKSPRDDAEGITSDKEQVISGAIDTSPAQKPITPKKSPKLVLRNTPTTEAKSTANDGEPSKKKTRINLVTIRDRERTPSEKQRYVLIESFQMMKAAKKQLRRAGARVTPVDGIDNVEDESDDSGDDNDFSNPSD